MADDETKATDKRPFLGLERAEGWFWIKWVLATLVGGAVGGTVGGLVGGSLGAAAGVFWGLVVGWAVVGTAQWLVLRRRVARSGWWVLATGAGGLAGGLVGGAMGGLAGGTVGLAVSWAAVGTAQWLVLRKRVRRSGRWVWVTAVGGPVGLVGGAVVGAIGGLVLSIVADVIGLMPHYWVGFADLGGLAWTLGAVVLTSWATALLVCGAITAYAMIGLLRHPVPGMQDPRQKEIAETRYRFLGLEPAHWWFRIKWLSVSAVGVLVGLFGGVFVGQAVGKFAGSVVGEVRGEFVGLAVGWIVLQSLGGAIAGFALIMLRQHPIPEVRDPRREKSSAQGGSGGLSEPTEGIE